MSGCGRGFLASRSGFVLNNAHREALAAPVADVPTWGGVLARR